MSSNWPVRQHTPHPTPPARKFMRRCDECGADFMSLAPGKTGERGLWTDTGWFCSRECRDHWKEECRNHSVYGKKVSR